MKSIQAPLIGFALILAGFQAAAQDEMLSMLQKEAAEPTEKVILTFKGYKIINVQSPETVKKRNLDFRVTHLFGNIGSESGGGFHTLYGIDQSYDIRIAFIYGLTDRLNIGFSRVKRNENLEGEIKYKALEQSTNNKVPVTVTVFGNMTYSPKEDPDFTKTAHRMTYVTQAIIARKFSSHFSLEVVPSYLHRNLVVEPNDENDILSIGAGGRFKFTRSASIIADYVYNIGRPDLYVTRYAPLGIGFEIETGGHLFSVMFTNASGILENDYIANTVDSWGKGGMKFAFHISRMFSFQKKK